MILESFHISNFRRLRDVHIVLDDQKTIFVGANNSGKTSAARIFSLFVGEERGDFSIHDFSGDALQKFDAANSDTQIWPAITLDLWFRITATDLHRVIDLLPSLNWTEGPVGVRLEYAAKDSQKLYSLFDTEQKKAKAPPAGAVGAVDDGFQGWPISMTDFLSKKLRDLFQIHYYVLDRSHFDEEFYPKANFSPAPLIGEADRGGAMIMESLMRVDFMDAQRHLSDRDREKKEQGRAENLSKRLSRFYSRNLKKPDTDFKAMKALADSEKLLNEHLASVFAPTLSSLNGLGYPGVTNPHLLIKSVLSPETILHGNTHVHYSLRDEKEPPDEFVLPDRYNGLGFKNLIYMVVELLDYHGRWQDREENQALLHIIIIEEPEAHLHAQLQQVFIREILRIIPKRPDGFSSQFIITTHSSHIIYECGFTPVRYFRRSIDRGRKQGSVVLNLSDFYGPGPEDKVTDERYFLQRYFKLTHCDLFFADAAILVEGNVERLVLPAMILKAAPELQSRYLSVLEVGGAFAHKFKELIGFLGLTTLIITDLDSVLPKEVAPGAAGGDIPEAPALAGDVAKEEEDDEVEGARCLADLPGAVTSNQTLITWLPKQATVAKLLASSEGDRTQLREGKSPALVRVAYQSTQSVTWGEAAPLARTARTLEEAFGLENLTWCQAKERKDLGLRVQGAAKLSPTEISNKIYDKVSSPNFKKTDFALALIAQRSDEWKVPAYIYDGLRWLAAQFPNDEKKAPKAPDEPAAPEKP